jgi:hypothetical protein
MRTGTKAMSMCCAIALLSTLLCGVAAAAPNVTLTFYTLTAPHAAFGVPMQYRAAVTNNAATIVSGLTLSVTLTAPDSSVSTLLNVKVNNLAAGATTKQDNYFTTSSYSAMTGAFTLTATIKGGAGATLATQSTPLTVVAAPSNGVYVSIGGMGPASGTLGATTDYQAVTANLTGSSMSLTTNTTITRPDMTTVNLLNGTATTIAANSNSFSSVPFNTADFDLQTGTFTVTATVLSGSTVMATDTYSFTRSAVPSTAYVPMFEEMSMMAGVSEMRMMTMEEMMPMNAECNANSTVRNDYMMGGSGIAVADYDGDGFDDMYRVDMMGMGHLYHNNGDGTFTDMTMEAMIPMVMSQSGAIWGDVDNDGHPDLLIYTNNMGSMMGGGMQSPVLLHNNGDGTFEDVTMMAGIPQEAQNFTGATFGDYDGDGFLDLVMVSHVDCMGMNPGMYLLHNNGDGTFADVTNLLGTGHTDPRNTRRGLVAAFIDYNGDGRQDLYIANDEGTKYGGNVLWRNDGAGGAGGWMFTDVSAATGANLNIADMGIAIFDYKNNGTLSMFNTNVGQNVQLTYNAATGKFAQTMDDNLGNAHVARKYIPDPRKGKTGLLNLPLTWGAAAYDFNNDGNVDIFAAGGAIAGMAVYNNVFFQNNGDGTFNNISLMTMTSGMYSMMPGSAVADFNNDGFMDIYEDGMVDGMMMGPYYYVNMARANGNPYNWLEVKLMGGCTAAGGCTALHSNTDGIGAKLVAMVGSKTMTRWVTGGETYQGNNTRVQHFGLGTATQVDTLTITWPSGKVQTLTNVAANQKITANEP